MDFLEPYYEEGYKFVSQKFDVNKVSTHNRFANDGLSVVNSDGTAIS